MQLFYILRIDCYTFQDTLSCIGTVAVLPSAVTPSAALLVDGAMEVQLMQSDAQPEVLQDLQHTLAHIF